MNPATIKTLMSLVGTIAAAAMLVPQLLPYQAALSALSAGLLAWAHGKRPGDASASHAEGLRSELELLKGEGPKTPRSVPPSVPPTAAALLLLAGALALSPALPACSSATPQAAGAQAAQTARLAYNATAVAVQALITVQTAWTDAIGKSGDAALAAKVAPVSAKTAAALDAAAGALGRARQYLDAGDSEAKVRQQLREAVGFADLAVELLGAAGRPLPDKAVEALDFLRGFLGGAQ